MDDAIVSTVSSRRKGKWQGMTLRRQVYYVGLLEQDFLRYLLVHDGEFLVRKVPKSNYSCGKELCVRQGEVIHQIVIRKSAENKFHIGEPQFGSIPAMVTFYLLNKISVVDETTCTLKLPFRGTRWPLSSGSVNVTTSIPPDKGSYSLVWKGTLQRHSRKAPKPVFVRIATANSPVTTADEADVYSKCRKLSQLHHYNIVRFVGMTVGWGMVRLVSELCGVSLQEHLVNNTGTISVSNKVFYCYQIACGMHYLANKELLLKVLKTGRCMMKSGAVKVGGLDKDILMECHAFEKPDKLESYRWMAPETLVEGTITTASNVWSYGVTAWEVAWDGALPYPQVTDDQKQAAIREKLISAISSGYRMAFPYSESLKINQLFQGCLLEEPQMRPNFASILNRLKEATGTQKNRSK